MGETVIFALWTTIETPLKVSNERNLRLQLCKPTHERLLLAISGVVTELEADQVA